MTPIELLADTLRDARIALCDEVSARGDHPDMRLNATIARIERTLRRLGLPVIEVHDDFCSTHDAGACNCR